MTNSLSLQWNIMRMPKDLCLYSKNFKRKTYLELYIPLRKGQNVKKLHCADIYHGEKNSYKGNSIKEQGSLTQVSYAPFKGLKFIWQLLIHTHQVGMLSNTQSSAACRKYWPNSCLNHQTQKETLQRENIICCLMSLVIFLRLNPAVNSVVALAFSSKQQYLCCSMFLHAVPCPCALVFNLTLISVINALSPVCVCYY